MQGRAFDDQCTDPLLVEIRKTNPYAKSVFVVRTISTGLRGQSPHILVLEEAAFLNPKVFFEAVAPLMGNDNVAVLGISTPNNVQGNYYSALLEMERPDGTPLFKVIDLEVACKTCKEAGIPELCDHKVEIVPFWQTAARKEMLQSIFKDRPDLFAQEILGAKDSPQLFIFHKTWIDAFKQNNDYKALPPTVDVLYTAIDPAGGGMPSDYAIVTTTFHAGHIVVSFLYISIM